MKRILAECAVNTVCESSLCPNISECFSKKHAAFLISGNVCTRSCGFCYVKRAIPGAIDSDEPVRISSLVKRLNLKYVMLTSVTRDDLHDGGASQFVKVLEALRESSKDIRIELLVPDFGGRIEPIERIVKAGPDILGHNIETVKRLHRIVRPGFFYERSLCLLRMAKEIDDEQVTKSGMMVGLGETEEEVVSAMEDLRQAGCDILTIGQYLRPSEYNLPIEKFVALEEFERYKMIGREVGFIHVSSGPFVRSSYYAEEIFNSIQGETYDRCQIATIG